QQAWRERGVKPKHGKDRERTDSRRNKLRANIARHAEARPHRSFTQGFRFLERLFRSRNQHGDRYKQEKKRDIGKTERPLRVLAEQTGKKWSQAKPEKICTDCHLSRGGVVVLRLQLHHPRRGAPETSAMPSPEKIRAGKSHQMFCAQIKITAPAAAIPNDIRTTGRRPI